jgi:hypothetical protein
VKSRPEKRHWRDRRPRTRTLIEARVDREKAVQYRGKGTICWRGTNLHPSMEDVMCNRLA